MSKDFDILSYFEKDIVRKQRVILLSTFLISLIMAVFPILLILTTKNSMIGLPITLKGIGHFIIILLLSNLIATLIGSTVGIIVKNDFSILISGAIYGLLLLESTQISNTLIHKYLNIFDDYLTVSSNTLSEVIFNGTYYLDKLFLLLLILLIHSLVRCVYGQKKRTSIYILPLFIFFALVCTYILGARNLQTFVPYEELKTDAYSIQSYKMELELQNKLYNRVMLKVSILEDIDKINLILDRNFIIDNLQIDQKTVSYTHENNSLLIQSAHQKGEEINLYIEYGGKVYVENGLGVISFYTTPSAINLPGHVFYWYPKISNNEESEFDVTIDTPATIYSNLTKVENKWHGTSINLHLFAGQYQKISQENIDYIFPISYQFENFRQQVEGDVKYLLKTEDLSEAVRMTLEEKKYKQVIVGVWPLDMEFVELNGETLLINFID